MEYKLYRVLNPDCTASLCVPILERYFPLVISDTILDFVTRINLDHVPPVYHTDRMKICRDKYSNHMPYMDYKNPFIIELIPYYADIIAYLPEHLITQKLCNVAVQNGARICNIPHQFRNPHLYANGCLPQWFRFKCCSEKIQNTFDVF